MNEKTMNEQEESKAINPLMIQSYFDGELDSEELEALSKEEIEKTPTYEALSELRRVVRVDSDLAMSEIDGCALLDAINKEIDLIDKGKTPSQPMSVFSQPKRRTSKQFFQRWAPAMIGAACLLLSIPGLVHWIVSGNQSTQTTQPQTVVVIDSNGSAHSQNLVTYQQPEGSSIQQAGVGNNNSNQLTVEEMDFAIRHLMKRIETLEEANTRSSDIESHKLFNIPETDDNQL